MKALVLTSNRPRHRYFAATLARCFDATVALSESKRNYYVEQQRASAAVQRHFARIAEAEQAWLGALTPAVLPRWREVADINDAECVAWAVEEAFDAVCLYGTGILRDGWLDAFPGRIVNLHLGLSPHYRGSATLFWPFFYRELQWLGTTIHLATAKIDAGAVLARVTADLRPGEDYYAITTRLIRDSIDRFPAVVADYLAGRIKPQPQESANGRFCRKADFNEEALHDVLAYAGDGLTPDLIAGIEGRRP